MNDDDLDKGLRITETEFTKLKPKEQMAVLYKNQVTTIELLRSYKLHQKIQYSSIAAICSALVYIATKIL